jgi:hypothetical protein
MSRNPTQVTEAQTTNTLLKHIKWLMIFFLIVATPPLCIISWALLNLLINGFTIGVQ